jgi:hypothetical protein
LVLSRKYIFYWDGVGGVAQGGTVAEGVNVAVGKGVREGVNVGYGVFVLVGVGVTDGADVAFGLLPGVFVGSGMNIGTRNSLINTKIGSVSAFTTSKTSTIAELVAGNRPPIQNKWLIISSIKIQS